MKKKKGFFGRIFSLIGTLILIALGLVIALTAFLLCSTAYMKTVTDDVDAYAAAEPMELSQRLAFSTEGDVTMQLDKSDIYWYYRQEKGEDFDEQYRDAMESVGIRFEGCGLNIRPKSISVDLSGRFGPMPLHVRIPSRLSYNGRELVLAPEAVKIGIMEISLNTLLELADEIDFLEDRLDVDEDDIEDAALRVPCVPAFLESIDSIRPGEDCLVVKGRMNTDFLENCFRGYNSYNLDHSRFLCEGYTAAEDIIESRIDSREAAEKRLFALLSDDPARLDDVLWELMCFMDQTVSSEYTPNLENHNFMGRVADVSRRLEQVEQHRILEADYNENKKNWDNFVNALTDDYERGKLKAENGKFLFDGAPFDVVTYLGKDWNLCENFIDPEDCVLALVNVEEEKSPKAPAVKKLAADAARLPDGLDPETGYPLAVIIRGRDGGYWAGFRVHVDVTQAGQDYLRLYRVSDAAVEAIRSAAAVPVWNGK